MPRQYKILSYIRLILFLSGMLFWIVVIHLGYLFRSRALNEELIRLAYNCVRAVINIRVTVKGKPIDARPLLLVSNHFTYLDVYVLGSQFPVHFTPKNDVAAWPLIGYLCKLAGCIFIDRRVSKTKDNQSDLVKAIQNGWVISLFPEGTTGDGTKLLPFRSSFFSLAEAPHHVAVQPACVRYTHINGEPMKPEWLPLIGWYGDMTFFPHLISVLSLLSISAEVEFYPQLNAELDRKALAAAAYDVISQGYQK